MKREDQEWRNQTMDKNRRFDNGWYKQETALIRTAMNPETKNGNDISGKRRKTKNDMRDRENDTEGDLSGI